MEDAAKNETTSGGDCEEETGADPKKAEQEIYNSKFSGGVLSSSLTHQLVLIYRSLVVIEEDGEEVDPHIVVHIPQYSNKMEMMTVVCLQLHLHYTPYGEMI